MSTPSCKCFLPNMNCNDPQADCPVPSQCLTEPLISGAAPLCHCLCPAPAGAGC
jgi:hypothetical protein